MKKSLLNKYADLIVEKGVNVQKGQDVYIVADLDQPEFVKTVVEKLYKNGARKVVVDFSYQPITKIGYKKMSLKTLSSLENYQIEKLRWRAEKLPAHLYLISDDPDGLKGVPQEKITKSQIAKYPIIKPFRDQMEGKYQWCIAAVAGKAWAKKVFPNEKAGKAMEMLWEAILKCSRVDDDPIAAWDKFNKEIKERCDYLNELGLVRLNYKSSNGTDFTVGLNKLGVFHGGFDTTLSGVRFNPNIPSEEIFTSPKYGDCEGVVYATKPLSYQGQLIENFSITFKNGKVSDVKAEKGEELLKQMVKMDEGAGMLGECALVPFESPINMSGILFYETLYDENACCHLALGRGFPDCLKGYENMTNEEYHKNGINNSMIHVDFMIGSRDLSITGITKDGKEVAIFKNGTWAFNVK